MVRWLVFLVAGSLDSVCDAQMNLILRADNLEQVKWASGLSG